MVSAGKARLNISVRVVVLRARELISMAEFITTFELMPSDVDTDLEMVESASVDIISKFGRVDKSEVKPLAFGLKSLVLYAVFDEKKNVDTEKICSDIKNVKGVEDCSIIDVRRTVEF